ncbi:MAG: class I SAM-dependent methyltransferase [Micromonosporaceae bacterium]
MSAPLASFDDAWAYVQRIPGWLKLGQARMLWDAALRLRPGQKIVEIGSHQGRSTVILAAAARQVDASVIAIDPFVDGKLFGGTATRAKFAKNIADAGLDDVVELVVGYSTQLRPSWERRFDLLYIDGKHDYWTFTDDLRWASWLSTGGEILVHDCYSSIGVTAGVLAKVLTSRRLTYLERSDSMARFVVGAPATTDRARVLREMPWFTRNVAIKVALRLWPGRKVTVLGHTGPHDPY